MQNTITKGVFMQAPCMEQMELNNLFFELTRANCNLKCKNCYLLRDLSKDKKDFLKIEKIKSTLDNVNLDELKSIYLTGGEPMMHPDFNNILRLCLKYSSTTIMTNGTFINEKKARFLRKIDDESEFETVFRISLDSWDEQKNDLLRGLHTFRKIMLCITSLVKYEFNPIISYVNYENQDRDYIFDNFKILFKKYNLDFEDINLKIIPYFDKTKSTNDVFESDIQSLDLDCKNSRIVSVRGIFACPVLCNDFRARMGENINDINKKVFLDTDKCKICIKNNKKAFSHEWI